MTSLLDVRNIRPVFNSAKGSVAVVDEISFTMDPGEVVGIVGESGCGKSVTALSIMGLLPQKQARVETGNIYFKQEDLLKKSKSEMKKIIGKEIAMIFQEPMTSLNPVLKIGKQIGEVLKVHENLNAGQRKQRVLELMARMGIDSPEKRFHQYPHQLSGGMRQRVMIAMALACRPDLLIADEPTTALDVTIQAQILEIIKQAGRKDNMAVLMITHDLGVVAEMAQKVIVMYAGKILEQGPVKDIFKSPLHPYTKGLLNSVPGMGKAGSPLFTIRGSVPEIGGLSRGCRFSPRCSQSREICRTKEPVLGQMTENRMLRCWKGTKEFADG